MDIRMGDMDGLTAIQLVKEARRSTAVVIVTSFESARYLHEAYVQLDSWPIAMFVYARQVFDPSREIATPPSFPSSR